MEKKLSLVPIILVASFLLSSGASASFEITDMTINNGSTITPPATFNISANVSHPDVSNLSGFDAYLLQNKTNAGAANWIGKTFTSLDIGRPVEWEEMSSNQFSEVWYTFTDVSQANNAAINFTTANFSDNVTAIPLNSEVRLINEPSSGLYNPMKLGNISKLNGTGWTSDNVTLEKGVYYFDVYNKPWQEGNFIAVRNETENQYGLLSLKSLVYNNDNSFEIYGVASDTVNLSQREQGLDTILSGFDELTLRAWAETSKDHETKTSYTDINSTLRHYEIEFDVKHYMKPDTSVEDQIALLKAYDSQFNVTERTENFSVAEVRDVGVPASYDFGSTGTIPTTLETFESVYNRGNAPFDLNVTVQPFTNGDGDTISEGNVNVTYREHPATSCETTDTRIMDVSQTFGSFNSYGIDFGCPSGEVNPAFGLDSTLTIPDGTASGDYTNIYEIKVL